MALPPSKMRQDEVWYVLSSKLKIEIEKRVLNEVVFGVSSHFVLNADLHQFLYDLMDF